MEILETLLVSLASIAVIVVAALFIRKEIKPKEKVKLSDEEKKKLEKAKKAFENLMKYDEDEALKRK